MYAEFLVTASQPGARVGPGSNYIRSNQVRYIGYPSVACHNHQEEEVRRIGVNCEMQGKVTLIAACFHSGCMEIGGTSCCCQSWCSLSVFVFIQVNQILGQV